MVTTRIPKHVKPGTPVEEVIGDETFLKYIRMNSVGELKFYVHSNMPNQTLFFSLPKDAEVDLSGPIHYVGVLDEEYAVYVGEHNSVIYHMLQPKEVAPDTHDVIIRVALDHGQFMNASGLFYTIVPVVKRKEFMQW